MFILVKEKGPLTNNGDHAEHLQPKILIHCNQHHTLELWSADF